MKVNCDITDFQPGDMIALKKGWTFAQAQYGFVKAITNNPPRVQVRHGTGEIKQYRPEELKNITGGNTTCHSK